MKCKIVGAALLAAVMATGICSAASNIPILDIGLMEGQRTATIDSTANLIIENDKGKTWKKLKSKEKATIAYKSGKVWVNGKEVGPSITIEGESKKTTPILSINNQPYRGGVKIVGTPKQDGMTIINQVGVEDYLYGVVGKEMSSGWPLEALKAQAVAARTFAIAHIGSYKTRGYDMTADVNSQVYGGIQAEAADIIQAVDQTKGEIMTYGGKPIAAYFSASAGGYTENSEDVWSEKIPYIRAVTDPSDKMPSYRWQMVLPVKSIEAVLKSKGKDIGTLQSITVSPLNKRPMKVKDRGVSGRIKTVVFKGTKGTATMTGNDMRSAFGLKSTLFDFYFGNNVPDNIDKDKVKRADELKIGKAKELTLVGYGWGHGLGMSQWGARQMAEASDKKEKDVYLNILKHYYTNIKVEKAYK